MITSTPKSGLLYHFDASRISVVAEVACSHDGRLGDLLKLIDGVKNSGADLIQFQLFKTSNLIHESYNIYDYIKSLELTEREWHVAINKCMEIELPFSLNFLDDYYVDHFSEYPCSAVKLHSSDLNNIKLLKKLSAYNVPVILGVGASTSTEINLAIAQLARVEVNEIILMYGHQSYPTPIDEINLLRIQDLKRNYRHCRIGYADHTDLTDPAARIIPLFGIALGATVLERHVTLNRSLHGTDYISSLEPGELKNFVSLANRVAKCLGETKDEELGAIDTYRKTFKKSLCSNKIIEKGQVIEMDDLIYLRTGNTSHPLVQTDVLGRRAKYRLNQYTILSDDMLESN